MATSTESNPPARDRGPSTGAATASASGPIPGASRSPLPSADSTTNGPSPAELTHAPTRPSSAGPGPGPNRGPAAAGSPPTMKVPGATSSASTSTPRPGESNLADLRGMSAASESQLERLVLRRNLATLQEVEAAKGLRNKLAAQDKMVGLLQILVRNQLLTLGQAQRLVKELSNDAHGKLNFPGYQILEKIGKGSMGMVYKARQTSVDRIVAIKVLLDALAQNREFIKRFEREAKIAAKLSHNNIVNAIDAGEVDGRHFFVMEFVEGLTIKDELDKGNVYDEKEALRIILAIAEALKHAHQRGLIHRDIKPENIILTGEGGVKLADLGLARPTDDGNWAMAEAGMAIGTPYYISPEQVRGQVDVDIRADIYSLGATLYHMITGRVPYEGTTPAEVMRLHVSKDAAFAPPDHINPALSSGLGEVVETMMAKNRENRYRNPDDLILDLKCLQAGERPLLAEQKAETLSQLGKGDATEADESSVGSASEAQLVELAGYVNGRNSIIAGLGILLALSVVSNIVFLAIH